MRIPFTVYSFSPPSAISEEQFIALKVYPEEMRRTRTTAMRGTWAPILMRVLGCILLAQIGLQLMAVANNRLFALVAVVVLAGALSLLLTVCTYVFFRIERAMFWYDLQSLVRRHEDYAPFIEEGLAIGLFHSRSREDDQQEGAFRSHLRGYSQERLLAMQDDASLSDAARARVKAELQRRT